MKSKLAHLLLLFGVLPAIYFFLAGLFLPLNLLIFDRPDPGHLLATYILASYLGKKWSEPSSLKIGLHAVYFGVLSILYTVIHFAYVLPLTGQATERMSLSHFGVWMVLIVFALNFLVAMIVIRKRIKSKTVIKLAEQGLDQVREKT